MSQELNILNLCENCATALRNTIDSNVSKDLNISLNQKLFLLETALDDFKKNHIDFEKVFNHLIDAIYITDRYGKTIYVNQSYLDLSGFKKQDLIGKRISEINSDKELFINNIISTVLTTKGQAKFQDQITFSDKELFITGLPIPDELGHLKYAIAYMHVSPIAAIHSVPESTYSAYLKSSGYSLKKSVESFEKDIIRDAIAQYGSKRKAATALGVDHSTLIKKCQRYGI